MVGARKVDGYARSKCVQGRWDNGPRLFSGRFPKKLSDQTVESTSLMGKADLKQLAKRVETSTPIAT